MRQWIGRLAAWVLVLAACPLSAAEWVAGWQQTAPLNTQRAGAAVVTSGRFLYAIGGVDGQRFLRSVEFSEFLPDGSLAPWRYTRALTEQRGFLDAAVHRGFVYVVGGGNGPHGEHLLRSVERARILDNGALGPWQRLDSALNVPRRCVKLVVQGDRLYALGGFGGTLLDTVEGAEIRPDGTLGPWRLEAQRLTVPRYVNAVKQAGGRIYVLGGHREREGVGIAATESIAIDDRGQLQGRWRRAAALGSGRYALAAASHGDELYALGGLDGAIYQDTIEVARRRADGSLSGWEVTTPLSSPRANLAVTVHDDRIYVIGGTNRDGYYSSVEFATFDDHGAPGFMASAAEASAYAQRRQARAQQRAAAPLPNAGQVLEVIQTQNYSYLKVMRDGGALWLAAPRAAYQEGERIRFSRGLTMTDFFSRTLQRRFDEILFVERIDRAASP